MVICWKYLSYCGSVFIWLCSLVWSAAVFYSCWGKACCLLFPRFQPQETDWGNVPVFSLISEKKTLVKHQTPSDHDWWRYKSLTCCSSSCLNFQQIVEWVKNSFVASNKTFFNSNVNNTCCSKFIPFLLSYLSKIQNIFYAKMIAFFSS